jgi:hypothetical protein
MIIEWAADPSRVVEAYSDFLACWYTATSPSWHPSCAYRFKPEEPKYIVVNGVNVPEPVRGGLEAGRVYWLASPAVGVPLRYEPINMAETSMNLWLSFGLVHLTKEAAQAHIDAMLLPSRTDK